MSRTRRWRVVAWVLAVIGAFILGVLLTRCLTQPTTVGLTGTGDGTSDRAQTFAITGDLSEPVSPGILVPLDLSFSNSHDQALMISGVTVTVESVDAPHATALLPCSVDDFVVDQLDTGTELRVDAGDTRTLTQLDIPEDAWPRVGMVDSDENQDGCKAAILELSYAATGRFGS